MINAHLVLRQMKNSILDLTEKPLYLETLKRTMGVELNLTKINSLTSYEYTLCVMFAWHD